MNRCNPAENYVELTRSLDPDKTPTVHRFRTVSITEPPPFTASCAARNSAGWMEPPVTFCGTYRGCHMLTGLRRASSCTWVRASQSNPARDRIQQTKQRRVPWPWGTSAAYARVVLHMPT